MDIPIHISSTSYRHPIDILIHIRIRHLTQRQGQSGQTEVANIDTYVPSSIYQTYKSIGQLHTNLFPPPHPPNANYTEMRTLHHSTSTTMYFNNNVLQQQWRQFTSS